MQRRQLTKYQYRWLGAFLVIVIGVVYYISWSRITKEIGTTERLRSEEKVVQAQSANIDSFFQVFGDAVAVFARTPYLGVLDTQAHLDSFMEQWKGTNVVQGIIYADTEGNVLYNADLSETSQVGESIAHRAYFTWATEVALEGQYRMAVPVESTVFDDTDGTTIVPVVAPVYKSGERVGVVVTAINLSELIESYLGIVDDSARKEVSLVTQEGNFVYHSSKEVVPLEDIVLVDHSPFTADPDLEGRVEDILYATTTGSFRTQQHLVTYSPIKVGENKWLIVSLADSGTDYNLITPVFIQYTSIFLFVVFTTILIFAFSVRGFPVRIEITEDKDHTKR